MEDIIHKVTISEEAIFDYEHCMIVRKYDRNESDTDWNLPCEYDTPLVKLPKMEIKRELEEYIALHNTVKYKHYFRARHYDEQLKNYLLIFVKKTWKLGNMQNWDVVGICYESDWCQEYEEDGFYKNWYDTKITDLDDIDWVEEMTIRKFLEELAENKDKREMRKYERLFGRVAYWV